MAEPTPWRLLKSLRDLQLVKEDARMDSNVRMVNSYIGLLKDYVRISDD